jgi:hypothetical protein
MAVFSIFSEIQKMQSNIFKTSFYPTGHPTLALILSVTSMYPTWHPVLALDPFVMSMHPTGHSS